MPRRKMVSALDARAAINRSFDEWGLKPATERSFSSMVTTQALESVNRNNLQNQVDEDLIKLPSDREEAIREVFKLHLSEYLDPAMFEKRSMEAEDGLKAFLSFQDDETRILHWAPYNVTFNRAGVRAILRKKAYEKFKDSMLNPLTRFSLKVADVSPAQLAYIQCSQQSWLDGFSFEAMVASHAIYNEACFRCKKRNVLRYSGGYDTSWRDIFCSSCQSCYEIKTKKDSKKIASIFKFKQLSAGSFRAWCREEFRERTRGSDFIVFVNRTADTCLESGGRMAWKVHIAEISTVLPSLVDKSFVDMGGDVTIKTIVSLNNNCTWFNLPVGCEIDLKKAFQVSYEVIFPGQWEKSTSKNTKAARPSPVVKQAENQAQSPARNQLEEKIDSIEDLRQTLKDLAVDN